MTFAERLRELRASRGLTQKDVYTAIGLSPIVYQRYEYGRSPSYEKLLSLADYFKVSLDYLVGRSNTPYILKNEDVETLSPEELEFVRKRREANR